MELKINQLIKRSDTNKKELSDFPSVYNYITKGFPSVNVGDVPVYLTSDKGMSFCGFGHAGGLYVPHMRIVFVRKNLSIGSSLSSAFDKALDVCMKNKVEVEDVLVHEMIHAVSSESGRSNRVFSFDEEEFVYTNSINFYKQKNMSDMDIVNKIFLPFCVQDVLSNKTLIGQILFDICNKYNIEEVSVEDQKKVIKIFGKYSDDSVSMVIDLARNMGMKMIDLYNKYGKGLDMPPLSVCNAPRHMAISID